MQSTWIRKKSSRLVRTIENSFSSDSVKLEIPDQIETMAVVQHVALRDRCYPARSAQPSCITLPPVIGNNFEIKGHHISMLPKFTGSEGEDPYLFLHEFEEVCALQKLQQLTEDSFRLRLINFALKESAKKWLYSLPANSISSWEGFVVIFLKKYFPNHKTTRITNEINQFHQKEKESFWKYFDRFKNLLSQCPHHGIEKWRLCKIIYEALDSPTTALLESMCQGKFMEKDEDQGWEFFEELAEKTMLWESTRDPSKSLESSSTSRGVHSIGNSIANDAKLATLTRRLEALETSKTPSQVSMCPNYNQGFPNYPDFDQVNAVFQPTPKNDPYSSHYNPGWKNHPNFSWNQGQSSPSHPPQFQNQPPQFPNQSPSYQNNQSPPPSFQRPNTNSNSFQHHVPYPTQAPTHPPGFNESDKRITSLEKSLDALLKSTTNLAQSQNTFMQTMTQDRQILNASTQALSKLEFQMSQLASAIHEREKNKLPNQPEVNPRLPLNQRPHENVNSIISLRSGTRVDNHVGVESPEEEEESNSASNPPLGHPVSLEKSQSVVSPSPEPSPTEPSSSKPISNPISDVSIERVFIPKVPYPQRLVSNKQSNQMEKILEVFKQVKINIPLLDAIQQIPSYAKCLKDLCTHKRSTQVPKKAFLTSHVSSILSNQIPVKYKDPGCPTISCVIGNTFVDKALLDLGASVNLLPFSVYQALGLGELKKTNMTLQLADRSVKMPKGIVEDVLIKVGDFFFPVDFVVLETQPVTNPKNQIPIILGRPFLATSNALINCRNGSMKLTFGNMTIDLNIFNIGKEPNELYEQSVGVNMVNKFVTWSSFEDSEIKSLLKEDFKVNYASNKEYNDSLRDMTSEEMLRELDDICSKWETPPEVVSVAPVVKRPVETPPTFDSTLYNPEFDQQPLGEDGPLSYVLPSDSTPDQTFIISNLLKQNKEALSWFRENISDTCSIGLHDSMLLEKIFSNQNFQMCLDTFSQLHPIFPAGIG